jgi:hypothetical protein
VRRATVVGLGLGAALAALSGVRCAGSTGDHRLRFQGTVQGSGPDGVTALGWTLHLERFVVAWGPTRVYSDAPVARGPADLRSRLAMLSFGVAWAQHCHGCPRAPVAEFGFERGGATLRALDLLAPGASPLGPANARNGLYRSVSFAFPDGTQVPDGGVVGAMLQGHSMAVRGEATREGRTIPFEGTLDLGPLGAGAEGSSGRPFTVYGVAFDRPEGLHLESADSVHDRVAVRVELARFFDQADFSTLPEPSTPGPRRTVEATSQVATAWRLGVRDPHAYRVGWVGAGGSGEPRPGPRPVPDAGR